MSFFFLIFYCFFKFPLAKRHLYYSDMWCDRVEIEQRIRVRVCDSLALKLCRESAERAETSAYCPTICIRKYRAVRITAGRPAEFSYERRSRGQRRNKFRPFPVARLRSCIRDEKKKEDERLILPG